MAKNTGKDFGLLNYRDGLDEVAKSRYDQKCKIIDGVDPYDPTLTWSKDENKLPGVLYPDISNYLIHSQGQYTVDDLKAWRSMEAVNQLRNGWVHDRSCIVFEEAILVTAKVMHSQRLREKPLQPWVITELEGPVKAAHCNCMAGLGEACSHIAALLWSIYATVAVRDSATVTESKAYWMLPNSKKTVQYKEVCNIDFTSTKSAKKKLGDMVDGNSVTTPKTPQISRKKIPRADHNDFNALCEKLNTLSVKPAILSLVPQYANDHRPKMDTKNFPKVLTDLKDSDCFGASVEKIKEICSKVEITCSNVQAQNVELETRLQSKTALWNKFRSGRITASRAKAVCATNTDSPAPSLIKNICYPDGTKFETSATKYGLEHEKKALDRFSSTVRSYHENMLVEVSGFRISTDFPYIGASPDGIVTCDCCGTACIEIKCPYSARDSGIDQSTCNFLQEVDGQIQLNRSHPYYYQVQTQLGVTGYDFAYFVVWSQYEIHVEQIDFDSTVWNIICEKSRSVFYNGILPELMGKIYTRLPNLKDTPTANSNKTVNSNDNKENNGKPKKLNKKTTTTTVKQNKNESAKPLKSSRNKQNDNQITTDENLYCICEQVEFGRMIGCDNVECPGEWFHYGCVNLENAPQGNWYCPDCRKLPAFKRKRSFRN